jgi:UDP-N-acetylmuramyl tripeptide synthase
LAALANRLAARFADTAAGLSTLEPSLIARRAQAGLSKAISSARQAYVALAAAAHRPARAQLARKHVYEAEANVNAALAGFSLLGYDQT